MKNVIEIDGYKALVTYDSDIKMFRGEFFGLNGGADFFAKDVKDLKYEGHVSLKAFLDMCLEDGAVPMNEQ